MANSETTEFWLGVPLCQQEGWSYATFRCRVDLGEIAMHLIDRQIQFNVAGARASMAKVKRRTRKVAPRDLFAA